MHSTSSGNSNTTKTAEIRGEENKDMAETKDLEQSDTCATEESQENAGGAKPDKYDQDGQDNKKQRFAGTSSALRTGDKREKLEWSETKKRVGCF
jgi:hypothetical protein